MLRTSAPTWIIRRFELNSGRYNKTLLIALDCHVRGILFLRVEADWKIVLQTFGQRGQMNAEIIANSGHMRCKYRTVINSSKTKKLYF